MPPMSDHLIERQDPGNLRNDLAAYAGVGRLTDAITLHERNVADLASMTR